ncbi:MAG TPA: SDR family NAD(P)-dependent oxidoreductase [Candidatus Deferrimicrobium sp.]|nr:SDR family NAD(P)-dependent oxidoreductase [Candidatus Deferrimicrobium sp.]
MAKLKNKNCLITGAASGIGRALAIGLAKEGMNLFITDLDLVNLDKVKEEIAALGVKVFTGKCDVSKYDDFVNLAGDVYAKLGEIDLLINNAGIGSGSFAESMELDDWKKVLDVNLWSIIYSLKVFLPRMLQRGSGHIVNTGSGAGVVGQPYHLDYVASKFAVVGISEGLYSEIHDRGIDVSVICPTIIKTNIIERSDVRIPPELAKDIDQKELDAKLELFKTVFWREYTKKGLTPEEAAKRYIKGIKKRKLYIFDKRIVPLAMFLKAVFQGLYKRILRGQGKEHAQIIEKALKEAGIQEINA